MAVLVLDGAGNFKPQVVTLTTLEDPTTMKGSLGHILGGVSITEDPADPAFYQARSIEQLIAAMVKNDGGEPRATFLDKDDALWPMDFDTWNMATAYYNIEQTTDYFSKLGVTYEQMGNLPIYYFADYRAVNTQGGPVEQQFDNAYFHSLLQAFFILPFEQLQKVPLSINPGVIAHEYSHHIFNVLAYGGERIPPIFQTWPDQAATKEEAAFAFFVAKGIDEGIADWNAVGQSCLTTRGCDPLFLASSLSLATAQARDMSNPGMCLRTDISNYYQLGTILAAALYHASAPQNRLEAMQRAVLAALSGPLAAAITNNVNTPENFGMATVADAILSSIEDADMKDALCAQFLARFPQQSPVSPFGDPYNTQLAITKAALPNCPAATSPANVTCN
jgi:hypothetical protein